MSKTEEEARTDMRILMLCELVERIADVVFTAWAVKKDNEIEEIYKALRQIKAGMGNLKE